MGNKGEIKNKGRNQKEDNAAERLKELNKRLLENKNVSLDRVDVKIEYKGETAVVSIPSKAIDAYLDKGEIPDPEKAIEAARALEEARKDIQENLRRRGEYNPLEATVDRLFYDAESTHLLNVIYRHDPTDPSRVIIRDDFRKDFNLEELDPIAKEIAASVLNVSPQSVYNTMDETLVHVIGTRVINIEGLGIDASDERIAKKIVERRDVGSHIEWSERITRVEVEQVSLSNKEICVNASKLGSVPDLIERAISKVPETTVKRYGRQMIPKIIATYVNASYLAAHGKSIEIGD